MKGYVFRRCWCRDDRTQRPYKQGQCPKLKSRGHGAFWFRIDVPPREGQRRRQPQYGPFSSKAAAEAELAVELARFSTRRPSEDRGLTFGAYLESWLGDKRDIKESTLDSYREAVRLYLKPALGHVRLRELNQAHFNELVAAMTRINRDVSGRGQPSELDLRLVAARADDTRTQVTAGDRRRKWSTKPLSPGRIHRVMAVAKSALNHAVMIGLLPNSPTEHVMLPRMRKPKPLVWTPGRVKRWQETGRKPSAVMVWTVQQTAEFFRVAAPERLYALYRLVTLRGLRRAEVVGLTWSEVDLDEGRLMVREVLSASSALDEFSDPKTEAGERYIDLDSGTAGAMRRWHVRQGQERRAMGAGWVDTGLVFTKADGRALRPDWVSRRLDLLVRKAGLPPVTFHGLRHESATLSLAAGVDMKVISETLGHARSSFTSDYYTSVLPEVSRAAAEATAALLPEDLGTRREGSVKGDENKSGEEDTQGDEDRSDDDRS